METTTEAQNKLQLLSKENGLSAEATKSLNDHFIPFFTQADEWGQKAKSLQVTDASQLREMKMAREARLALKDIRVNVEKTRKELKEDSLKKGKAIDGIANVLKGLIEPIELHLENQEKFAERQESARREALRDERLAQLKAYDFQYDNGFDLGRMDQPMFDALLTGIKKAHEDNIAAEAKAEQDRIAREEADRAERERLRVANEALRKANEAKDKAIAQAKVKADAERKALEDKAAKEKAASVAKLKAEVEQNNKLKAQLQAKADAEAQKKKDAELAERKAKRAPEKQKLITLANTIRGIELPLMKTTDGEIILKDVEKLIHKLADFITEKSNQL